jgi:predicted O-methyltransferase YrrM
MASEGIFRGFDDECTECGRLAGDHTLREWAKCTGDKSFDLPMADIPEDATEQANRMLRERFLLDDDVIVVDNVVTYATVLRGSSGPVGVKAPAVMHDFQSSASGRVKTVARVLFLADAAGIRAYGKLVRDAANGAANAAER